MRPPEHIDRARCIVIVAVQQCTYHMHNNALNWNITDENIEIHVFYSTHSLPTSSISIHKLLISIKKKKKKNTVTAAV